jgi:hypothetical protein
VTITLVERQLNIWGFVRKTPSGLKDYSFHHKCFIRNRPNSIKKIARKTDGKSFRRSNGIGIKLNLPSVEAKLSQRLALGFLNRRQLPNKCQQPTSPLAGLAQEAPTCTRNPNTHPTTSVRTETGGVHEEEMPPATGTGTCTSTQIHPPSYSHISNEEPQCNEFIQQNIILQHPKFRNDYSYSNIEYEYANIHRQKRALVAAFQTRPTRPLEPPAMGRVRKCSLFTIADDSLDDSFSYQSRGHGILFWRRSQEWLGKRTHGI